jgi:hypothetical protein
LATGTSLADTAYHVDEALDRAATDQFTQRVVLASLLAGIDAPFGTGVQGLFPFSVIRAKSDLPNGNTGDEGVGDVELRMRQDVTRPFGVRNPLIPRVNLVLGAVLPTGKYVGLKERITSGAIDEKYLSLGRGAYWLLADLEVSGRIGERFGWNSGVTSRTALGKTDDAFEWGREVRASVGASLVNLPQRFTWTANVEHQWRDVSFERDFLGQRGQSVNTGGRSLDVAPSVRAEWTKAFATTLSARLPLWRTVEGVQAVPSYGVFLTVSYEQSLPSTPTTTTAAL